MSGDANYNILLSQRKAAKKRITIGAILFCVGSIITVGTFLAAAPNGGTFIVSWGPMIFGAIRVFAGWNSLSRIDGQLRSYNVGQAPYTQPYGAQQPVAAFVQSSQPAQSAAPAGWHPDPSRRHELRYWDGATWTPHVLNNGIAAYDPS